ncbi:hypothetical protein AYO47_06305 [Planctomyces sp. SCGC AG-212-M04]|nr:hypothetical protein AYO47_06305 [Planctomyces sp. SCGC AG-212-M04]
MNREQCPLTVDLWPEVVGEPSRRDVAGHVARCRGCRGRIAEIRRTMSLLRRVAATPRDNAAPHPADADAASTAPEFIGDCRVLGVLGEGGQSVVYRAWHPRLNSEIAIKRLHSSAGSDAALTHEAMILSSVRSKAFPHPLDFQRLGDESFLFFELIHGEPLTVCGCELNPQQILNVIRELLAAVRELHASQLLHLDLSPGNVLVDENGSARLIDFGLARRSHEPRDRDLTTGGTPGFIAPELLDPQAEIDERADIYGAAAVLHFLLHGEPRRRELSERSLLRPELEADRVALRLAGICDRALEIDPDLRFGSAEHFLAALEEVDGRRSRARRWLAAGAVLGTLVLGHSERLLDRAQAEVLVVRDNEEHRLRESPPLHLGDHIAFAFDAAGPEADLIVRKPSGTLVRLRPFNRGPSGAFRFPPAGGAVLRQERGTYVVFFVAAKTTGSPGQLLRALGELPVPPSLSAGESVVISRGIAERALSALARPFGADWQKEFLDCEARFPGLVAIAFPVE